MDGGQADSNIGKLYFDLLRKNRGNFQAQTING